MVSYNTSPLILKTKLVCMGIHSKLLCCGVGGGKHATEWKWRSGLNFVRCAVFPHLSVGSEDSSQLARVCINCLPCWVISPAQYSLSLWHIFPQSSQMCRTEPRGWQCAMPLSLFFHKNLSELRTRNIQKEENVEITPFYEMTVTSIS